MTELSIQDLRVRVGTGAAALTAVDGVDLEIASGTVLGLVGESGSGKSTLARALVGLTCPSGGRVLLDGEDVTNARGAQLRALRRRVQLVFQDPRASLNPRMTIGDAIAEALVANRRATRQTCRAEVAALLERVALDPAHAGSRPGALSGGQRQRAALARALAVGPELLIADEVTASLDASVQGSVLNLLRELQRDTGLGLMFITHNLALARYLSDRLAVMHLGRVVEQGDAAGVLSEPAHPYTRTLIASAALDDLEQGTAEPVVEPPDPRSPPSGCRYHTVCPVGPSVLGDRAICAQQDPAAGAHGRRHEAACHFAPAKEEAAVHA